MCNLYKDTTEENKMSTPILEYLIAFSMEIDKNKYKEFVGFAKETKKTTR